MGLCLRRLWLRSVADQPETLSEMMRTGQELLELARSWLEKVGRPRAAWPEVLM